MKKIISLMLVFVLTFGIMAGALVTSNAATDVWESEPNNNVYNANRINFGQIIHGYSNDNVYDDFFEYVATSSLQIRFVFNHIKITSGHGFWGPGYWCFDVYKYDSFNDEYVPIDKYSNMNCSVNEGIYRTDFYNIKKGDRIVFAIESYNNAIGTEYMLSLETYILKVSNIRCSARNTSAQKIAWNKVSGASGYQVQRSNNGGTSWSDYYYTNSNSFVFNYLTAGGKYKFRARAYKTISGKDYYGAWSSTLCSCCTPAKPTLKKVSSPKHTQIKTTWAKASGTKSGYQILYGRNSSFSSIAARKNVSASKSSYTGKNFTKGRTYYVKVRTYTNFGGKTYYSAWSSAKKVKCK